MTIPHFADAPPLRTDSDKLDRVRALVGQACATRQVWIMLVDGEGRQLPTVLPLSGLPDRPDLSFLQGLERLLGGMRSELATSSGPGCVILTLERAGSEEATSLDREWRNALRVACSHARIALGGVFLSSDSGVHPLEGRGS
ncbi:hypothetical protein [Pseudonocardia spinosispora]|uniref:hypothetical protein n=1 Tax=Pseudonocardia spinosispora TaxID=103441 RepID=UPI00040B5FE3|nr:hypothetical protein [Pseudonocardia spinosispora]